MRDAQAIARGAATIKQCYSSLSPPLKEGSLIFENAFLRTFARSSKQPETGHLMLAPLHTAYVASFSFALWVTRAEFVLA